MENVHSLRLEDTVWRTSIEEDNSMPIKVSKMGKCKLCGTHGVLQESHVIPGLVRKGVSGTGAVEDPKYYVAQGGEFLKLEQDLPKKFWLCRGCEELLSDSEKRFAEAVYQPLWNRRTQSGKIYDDHVHRFLVSMAWRAWHWYDEYDGSLFSRVSNQDRLREAEEVWRIYLLGNRGDVAEFKQHMLVQSAPMAYSAGCAVDLNGYYWSRGVGLDLLVDGGSERTIRVIYTKIPKIAMFGIVEQKNSGYWRGTLVEPGLGDTWSGQRATVPDALLSYLIEQAEKMPGVLRGVPEKIRKKTTQRMDRLIETEGDDYLKRDAVRSMVIDDMIDLPEQSIISDAIPWLTNNADAKARRVGKILSRLSEAEMRSLHKETNRVGLRCKALGVEERFGLLADGGNRTAEPGKAILVRVEVFPTRKCAEERASLPLTFGLDTEEVTLALDAEIVPVPQGLSERGIKYLSSEQDDAGGESLHGKSAG